MSSDMPASVDAFNTTKTRAFAERGFQMKAGMQIQIKNTNT
jgi:hypothetical protein